ncbi:hypothetical protein [Pseudoclavibacter sp. VKM Ac-2867]|uniref:hypothetical protein n=1 Tax=Pseudoclavibacter sp. VKM Ac-2867 TaxID=2783829 RepID=UPI00188C7A85|nr:hypothetical protein [Pseudoclavibacter sp. VKM Ac-2867]MBF4459645.1 hypothetical protein [Pseudoclavibacter sp. VKM Ac-2867]
MNVTSQRSIYPGKDFSAWPFHKAARAYELVCQLRDEYNSYRASLGRESVSESDPTQRIFSVRARLRHEPDSIRWSLLFGDAIHNYRASLDAFAWEMAHLEGATLADELEHRLYFPLARTQAHWAAMVKSTLSSMPSFVRDRLEINQPFRYGEPDLAAGVVLHRLDLTDKHRASLAMMIEMASRSTFALRVESFENSDSFSMAGIASEELWRQEPVRDGALLWRFRSELPLRSLVIDKLPMYLSVSDGDENLRAFDLLDLIDRQVVGILLSTCFGVPSSNWTSYILGDQPRPEMVVEDLSGSTACG